MVRYSFRDVSAHYDHAESCMTLLLITFDEMCMLLDAETNTNQRAIFGKCLRFERVFIARRCVCFEFICCMPKSNVLTFCI